MTYQEAVELLKELGPACEEVSRSAEASLGNQGKRIGENYTATVMGLANELASALAEMEAVKAERDRLREALKEIASHRQKCHQYDEDTGQPLRDFDLEDIRIMEFAARAAIKQEADT